MKTFKYTVFNSECRKHIAIQAEASRALRQSAVLTPSFEPGEVAARRAHADEFFKLLKAAKLTSTKPVDTEEMATMREQGRTLKLKANIEQGRKRAALYQQRNTESRPLCRQYHWLQSLAKLKVREEVEGAMCFDIERQQEGVAFDSLFALAEKFEGGIEVNDQAGFVIVYKHGSVVFDIPTIEAWKSGRLPTNMWFYLITSAKAQAKADRKWKKLHGQVVEIDGEVVEGELTPVEAPAAEEAAA